MSLSTTNKPRRTKSESTKKRRNKKPQRSPKTESLPINIEKYSEIHKIPPFIIWEKIKKGQLIARELGGEIFILPAVNEVKIGERMGASSKPLDHIEIPQDNINAKTTRTPENFFKSQTKNDELPQLPLKDKFIGFDGELTGSPEVALLLDHLSIAKEENKEILKMAQKSLEQVKEATKDIVNAKDDVILSKEEKIQYLEEKLRKKEQDLNSTKQQLEDLEMLTKTLSSKKS